MDMTKFLSLLGLFTATSVCAQLTVKQDGTSEAYIFVTDQVLYVADDISVTKGAGSTADAKAGIYLREDAQLIQGATQVLQTMEQGLFLFTRIAILIRLTITIGALLFLTLELMRLRSQKVCMTPPIH